MQDEQGRGSMESLKEAYRKGTEEATEINAEYKKQGKDKRVALDKDYLPRIILDRNSK